MRIRYVFFGIFLVRAFVLTLKCVRCNHQTYLKIAKQQNKFSSIRYSVCVCLSFLVATVFYCWGFFQFAKVADEVVLYYYYKSYNKYTICLDAQTTKSIFYPLLGRIAH